MKQIMVDKDNAEIEALKKDIARLLSRLGRAMQNNTGIRFTAAEVQTLMLTDIGESAFVYLHNSQ